MITGHAYDKHTGLISADRYSGSTRELAMEFVPAGAGFIEGVYDHLRQRVDVDSGEVVAWESPELAALQQAAMRNAARTELQRLELGPLQRAQREAVIYADRDSLIRAVQIDLRCAQLASFLKPGPDADQRIERAKQRLAQLNQPASQT